MSSCPVEGECLKVVSALLREKAEQRTECAARRQRSHSVDNTEDLGSV